MHLVALSFLIAISGPPIAIEEIVKQDPDCTGKQVEIEGWVNIGFENVVICSTPEYDLDNCVWLNIGSPMFTKEAAVHSCKRFIGWAEKYHHRKVRVAGILRIGRSGHLGVFPAELDHPWVVEVLNKGDGTTGNADYCQSIVERFEKDLEGG